MAKVPTTLFSFYSFFLSSTLLQKSSSVCEHSDQVKKLNLGQMTKDCRKLHNDEHYNIVVVVTKGKKMGRVRST
jgi:hypothetical protein